MSSPKTGRPGSDARLRRLLAMVPWVASADGPKVDEVCTRFGITREELRGDLELLYLCGIPPYGPGDLIQAEISRGRVWIRLADYFAAPLRLTAAEALAVVAAGTGLLATAGTDPEGPLARGLQKLAASLGIDVDETVDIELGEPSGAVLDDLRRAVEERRAVSFAHYSYGRDQWGDRTVEPWRVFSSAGSWYVYGWCRTAAGERLFRLDRIRDVAVLDETFTPPAKVSTPPLYNPRPDDPVVVLELAPDARWVVETHPVESVDELPGGWLRVQLRVSQKAWLERLLLRLGPSARAVRGADGVAAGAARRILARYGDR